MPCRLLFPWRPKKELLELGHSPGSIQSDLRASRDSSSVQRARSKKNSFICF